MQHKSDYVETTSSLIWLNPGMEVAPMKSPLIPIWFHVSVSMLSDWTSKINCAIIHCYVSNFSTFSSTRRLPKNRTETRRDSSARRPASTFSERAGASGRSKWSEKGKVNSRHNSVPSSVSATRTMTCNSWISTMGSSTALRRLYSFPTPTKGSTLCWA